MPHTDVGSAPELRVVVREIDAIDDFKRAVRIYADVFGTPSSGDTVTVELLRVLSSTGHYVAAAHLGDAMVGFSAGLFGPPVSGTFHSHVTAVQGAARAGGVGRALKIHQRSWVADRGVTTISWTFDPLVLRNAHFNLVRLGARVSDYRVNFYGTLTDDINRGDHSDRLVVTWDLATGSPGELGPDRLGPSKPVASPILVSDTGDVPRRLSTDAELVTVAVPVDIETLRRTDLEAARAWRREVRVALQAELAAGGRIVGFGGAGYVVERGAGR